MLSQHLQDPALTLAFAGVVDNASATAWERWPCYFSATTLAVYYFLVMVNKALKAEVPETGLDKILHLFLFALLCD